MITFQEIVRRLSLFWEQQGCIIHQGYDLEVGAGTFNPATFLRCLGPEPYKAAYIEPCRRPADGRYGTNPNRLQHYFQFQVILKPSPPNIQDLYLQSLEAIGFKLIDHDIRFVHDDWESPTLGAWGLGWEVWMDGMEVTQFTYFQSVGGVPLKPITGEITYGIERLAMYLQKVDSIFEIQWNDELTYRDIYHRNEVEWSHYNFEKATTEMWFRHFDDYENEAKKLISLRYPIPAYDFVMKASHAFNLLDARGAISVTERTGYIARIRDLARQIAETYISSREELGFPLLKSFGTNTAKTSEGNLHEGHLPEEFAQGNPARVEEFLLEIGSEELPATFVPIGCQNLEMSLRKLLEGEGLKFKSIKSYGTPRRLAVSVQELALGKPAQLQEKRGPAVAQAFDAQGRPTVVAQGFFRSIQKNSVPLEFIKSKGDPDLSVKEVKGVEYLFGTLHSPGRATVEILAEKLPELILNLEFPKKMRWGSQEITYARPLRWIVSLFGKHVIPFQVGNLTSGRESWGHRQLCPYNFVLVKASDYLTILKEYKVLADMHERKKQIIHQLDQLESKVGGKIISRDQVIPQVLNLVEWPQVTYASFDRAFLKAPKEVLISEMVEHQKYFPVSDIDHTLKNNFVITADTTPTEQIRQGNQKVLSARLSDGVFLYEQGLKHPLEEYNEKLKSVTFQKVLGTVFDKMKRLVAHTLILQKELNIGDPQHAERAATLSKADLATEMVYEFPELQGTIGKYYALNGGESSEVATAIEEQWMPRGENAPLPKTPTGILLSLADKFDNLIGCFLADLKPTSSSDPYALRRQILGVIKMLIAEKQRLHLRKVLKAFVAHFPAHLRKNEEQVLNEIEGFITNRVKTVFLDYEFRKDEIEAALSSGFTDIYDAFCKVNALREFRESSDKFPLLYEVYKRAKGQLEGQKALEFSSTLLIEPAEIALDSTLNTIESLFQEAINNHQYEKAYELVSTLQSPLAALFEKVKILADDPKVRSNRIALLQRVFNLFSKLLDFSKIQEKE